MEITARIDSIIDKFSERFPDLSALSPLYVLAILLGLRDEDQKLFLIGSGLVPPFDRFFAEDLFPFDVKNLAPDELRTFFARLVEGCIESVGQIGKVYESDLDFFYDLLKTEPNAIWVRDSTPKNHAKLVDAVIASLNKVFITIENGDVLVMDLDALSNKAYIQFAALKIRNSFASQTWWRTPDWLVQLIVKQASPQLGNKIYDPNCGIGTLFVEFERQFPGIGLDYTGELSDGFVDLVCRGNLHVEGVTAFIQNNDPLEYESLDDLEFTAGISQDADIAISVLPARLRISPGALNSDLFRSTSQFSNAENAYVELMLNSLNAKGKAIVIVSDVFLTSPNSKAFRKHLLEENLLERVIALPEHTFATDRINRSIILFNKDRESTREIIFDGPEPDFKETKVSVDLVLQDVNFGLSARRYALTSLEELNSILNDTSFPKAQIKDLVESVDLGRHYSPEGLGGDLSETLPYIRVSDLAKDPKESRIVVDSIQRRVDRRPAMRVIDYDAVLISRIGSKLKPTRFDFEGQPIAIGSDVLALKLKDVISTDYFVSQLHSRVVQIQVDAFSAGAVINRISKGDFLNIRLIIPPLEEQRRQIFEMRGLIEEKAAQVLQVAEVENKARRADYELISSVVHSFKNKLSPIVMDYSVLLDFLRESEKNKEPIKLDTLIRPIFKGEDVQDVDTVDNLLNRLDLQLKSLPKLFNDFQVLQRESVDLSTVNLNGYLKSIEKRYSSLDFQISVESKDRSVLVEIDEGIFRRYVIENLIDNAKEHAFKDKHKLHQIVFEVSKTEEPDGMYVRLLYKDNGIGFQSNYTFENYKTFGNKSVYSRGTGIGGFAIHKIVELHGGKVKLLPVDEFEPFKTQIEITLPLSD